jgi:methionine-rich copper-binding protein CopC
MMRHIPRHRAWRVLGAVVAAVLLFPAVALAHSELETSDPAQGAVVPSPFTGPIVLTFSEDLAAGSKADLVGPEGNEAAAVVNGKARTMTFTLTAPLDPGAYEIRWVSIADDGDVLRQPIVKFTVAPAPSPSATPVPTASPTPAATATATAAPAAPVPSPSAVATPVPSGSGDATGSGGDVLLPIIVALIVLGAVASYLLTRRNRATDRS